MWNPSWSVLWIGRQSPPPIGIPDFDTIPNGIPIQDFPIQGYRGGHRLDLKSGAEKLTLPPLLGTEPFSSYEHKDVDISVMIPIYGMMTVLAPGGVETLFSWRGKTPMNYPFPLPPR